MHLFFIIALAPLFSNVAAQDSAVVHVPRFKVEKSIDLWLGYNVQGTWSDETGETMLKYLEVGIGKGKYFYHPHGITGKGLYLSEEILLTGNNRIYGTKLGSFVHWLFDAGFSIIYYTDFEKGNLKLRPELGVGMGRVRCIVGYNIPTIDNRRLPELQKQSAQITIQAGFGVKRKELKQ